MTSYFLHALSFVTVILFEYGFIHALSSPFDLLPISVCVGIYHIFHLRPLIGGIWLLMTGFAQDIHSIDSSGDIILYAIIAWLLIYVVEQHITHISIYASVAAAAAVTLTLSIIHAVIVVLFYAPIPIDLWVRESGFTFIFAMVLMWLMMIFVPRISRIGDQYIRVKI
jgi:hypothetical protein